MRNLSNTTVLSRPYQDVIDRAVTAVQRGTTDYNTAIRSAVRRAGQAGLRVVDGSAVVDYESGWSRRLDSAARMNILDGVRHLNQSIMEEIGRQTGADGVEISAHMLCAPDHAPYQGTQMTNEAFEQLQDTLERPFGDWNCKHNWWPIILGISEPAYTEEQLREYRAYSSNTIEIEGRTKTRYEWSQEMRRCETAIRQQKDVAKLAEAAGDETLQRQCQRNIVALQDRYKQLADGSELKPEYKRMYVQGFRDAKGEQAQFGERARLHTRNSNHVSVRALELEGFMEKFSGITGKTDVDKAIYECAKEALLHRNGTDGEDLYLIDGKTGERIYALITSAQRNGVSYDFAIQAAIDKAHSEGRTIIAIHNHPNGLPPTLDDGSSALVHGYDKGVAVGHNLEVFVYSKADKEYSPGFCRIIHNSISSVTVFNVDFEEEIWYSVLRKYGMEVERR